MSTKLNKAILKTLVYADVFDYPLMKEEIWKWLIKFKIQSRFNRDKIITKNLKEIREKEGRYYLDGRKKNIDFRKQKENWSEKKLRIAQKIISFLKLIPTIKLVGVTGALAINNAEEDDDIDLFIISSSNLLWTTRFLVTVLIEVIGKRRHPQELNVKNKICLNMFIDEEHLSVPRSERDLFSAHEVVQMMPLFERNQTYRNFLTGNQWVKKYLPNAISINDQALNIKYKKYKKDSSILNYIENLLKRLQLWYMRRRMTTEVISDGIIRFHPKDARKWILKEYKERLKRYKIN